MSYNGVNYKFTAGSGMDPVNPEFQDATALAGSLHPDLTIKQAMTISRRLGYDLVVTHVKRPEPKPDSTIGKTWALINLARKVHEYRTAKGASTATIAEWLHIPVEEVHEAVGVSVEILRRLENLVEPESPSPLS